MVGNGLRAKSVGITIFGRFNDYSLEDLPYQNYDDNGSLYWVSTEPLFVLANGTSDTNRSNAMVVLKNGNTTVNGSFTANEIYTKNALGGIPMGDFGRPETTE